MQTTAELRVRYEAAFKRYSTQSTRMREIRAALPDHLDSSQIHRIREECRVLSLAERDYRAARLDYIEHLLSSNPRSSLR